VKSLGSTEELQGEPYILRQTEVVGTIGGVVKCVDINRNAEGEVRRLGLFWRWGTKAWVANGIRYPGSPRRKRCALGRGRSDATLGRSESVKCTAWGVRSQG